MEIKNRTLAIAGATLATLIVGGWTISALNKPPTLSADGMAEFKAPPRSPDLSGGIHDNLASVKPPSSEVPAIKLPPPPAGSGLQPPANLPAPSLGAAPAQAVEMTPEALSAQTTAAIEQARKDSAGAAPASGQGALADAAVIAHLGRYGTPVTRQALPAGGLTMWTVISKSGKPVQLYTTADGKALFSGVVWNLETGQNLSDVTALPPTGSDPNYAARLPQVVAPTTAPKSNLTTGGLPYAFQGKVPTEIPEAIKLVDGLAGFKEGNGGPGETLYVIIDPRCPYCRRAYLQTREYVKRGVTIKWIPTAALGRPEQGLPLAATILRASSPDVVSRVLGNHEQLVTQPSEAELKQLDNNLDFMFEAFKQNNEPNPGVPVAFFVDRRSGKARMMMGVSEEPVIEDILGKLKK